MENEQTKRSLLKTFIATVMLCSAPYCLGDNKSTLVEIQSELERIKLDYENRIADLEKKIKRLESAPNREKMTVAERPRQHPKARKVKKFNPAIGLVLNGKMTGFSESVSEFTGFAVGEEGERGREGIGIDESEVSFSANVDDFCSRWNEY